jgi:hypothetical protein
MTLNEIHYTQDGTDPFELHVSPDDDNTGAFLLRGSGPTGQFEAYVPALEDITLNLTNPLGVPYIVTVEPRFGDGWLEDAVIGHTLCLIPIGSPITINS